jgi:hypothetical protein
VEKAYKRAVDILKANRDKLESLASILLEKEVIFSEDLETIFGKKIKHVGHEIVLTDIRNGKNGELQPAEVEEPKPKKRGRKPKESQ